MKTYNIYIREVLETSVEVQADDIQQAIEKGKEMYQNSEIVLDSNDLLDCATIKAENQDDTTDETDYQDIY